MGPVRVQTRCTPAQDSSRIRNKNEKNLLLHYEWQLPLLHCAIVSGLLDMRVYLAVISAFLCVHVYLECALRWAHVPGTSLYNTLSSSILEDSILRSISKARLTLEDSTEKFWIRVSKRIQNKTQLFIFPHKTAV